MYIYISIYVYIYFFIYFVSQKLHDVKYVLFLYDVISDITTELP